MELKSPEIFNYSDYRKYLADHYASRKSADEHFSHRLFARISGLSSPSHLLMIVSGKRNLSSKTISKFADGLRLKAKERKYFETLVHYDQTSDLKLKAQFFSELMALKAGLKKLNSLEAGKYQFLSKWYSVAIYVLVKLPEFDPEPTWIMKKLRGRLTCQQVTATLDNLKRLGLIEEDPLRGYRQTLGALSTEDDLKSMAVFTYHHEMMGLASLALRTIPFDLREINGNTMAIPKSKLPELKEKIRSFRKELNQLTSCYENPDEIYQLNMQLFPLTHSEKK